MRGEEQSLEMRTAREELSRFESLPILRPDQRLTLWKNERGNSVEGTMANSFAGGVSTCTYDLARHWWVFEIETDFDKAPGNYRIEYVCDPNGLYDSVGDIPEAAWIFLAVGRALQSQRFVGRSRLALNEVEAPAAHTQCPLFMRFIRVVCTPEDELQVSATVWRVWEEAKIDMTGRLEGDVVLTRQVDSKRQGKFVRPGLDFDLANDDGWLRLRKNPPFIPPTEVGGGLRDANGLSYVRSWSRWTYEVRCYGQNWEVPRGFEASGWWPIFSGFLKTRKWKNDTSNSVSISCIAGRRGLNEQTSQPLHEMMGADEFLRDWISVSDDRQKRLIGVHPPYPPTEVGGSMIMTSYEEFVGKSRVFGNNWWEPVFGLEPPERIFGICSTGSHLVALVLDHAAGPMGDLLDWAWWLVKYDFGGNELERLKIAELLLCDPKPMEDIELLVNGNYKSIGEDDLLHWGLYECADLCYFGGKIYVTVTRLNLSRWGGATWGWTPLSNILIFNNENWDMGRIGMIGLYGMEPDEPAIYLGGIVSVDYPDLDDGFCVCVHRGDKGEEYWHLKFFNCDGESICRVPEYGEFDGGMPRVMMSFSQGSGTAMLLACGRMDFTNYIEYNETGIRAFSMSTVNAPDCDANFLKVIGTSWAYQGLMKQGDYVLAAGFGKDSVQEIAKVARLGYFLENCRLRSAASGDLPVMNFGEPRIRVGGEILAEHSHYEVEHDLGHVSLIYLPENGLEIRASYDYLPTFGFVKIEDVKRYEVIENLAMGFGLVITIDAYGRLCWRPRVMEEVFVATPGEEWILGSLISGDGVPWIVEESIEVRAYRGLTEVDESRYSLSSEDWKFADGRIAKRWKLAALEDMEDPWLAREEAWRIRFQAQEIVPTIGRGLLSEGETVDADRVITKAVMVGKRRIPSDYPQRISQVFAVAPSDSELVSVFDRMKPVEGTKVFDWKPQEKIYEESEVEEKPKFHIEFNEPLLLGSSQWGIRYGKVPVLLYSTSLAFSVDKWFKKFDVSGAKDESYHVWIEEPGSYRVATSDDYDNMIGNCVDDEPVDAGDVRTSDHFYLRRMNNLGSETAGVIAYESEVRHWRQDADGRVVETDNTGVVPTEERFKTAYSEKCVQVNLEPRDVNEMPLFFENPIANDDEELGNELRLVVDRVQITSGGMRIDFTNFAMRENILVVEVIGYPVSEAEVFIGMEKSAQGIALYGELERREENDFVPNLEFARRIAGEMLLRRVEEPEQHEVAMPLVSSLFEDELVRVTDEGGVDELWRTVLMRHRYSVSGSRTEGVVER